MAWLDDRIWAHPKIAGVPVAARWLYVCSIAYSSGFGLYGILDKGQLRALGATPRTKEALIVAGLWEDAGDGRIEIHDWAEHNEQRDGRVAESRRIERRRKDLLRDAPLRDLVRKRDQNRCRFCGKLVDWRDRKSPDSGTYDWIDPAGGNEPENVIVSCRGCERVKGRRTPSEADMTIMPAPLDLARSSPMDQIGSDPEPAPDLAESDPASRASARRPREMTSDRVTRSRTSAGSQRPPQDPDQGLPINIALHVATLMAHIADHADDGTRHIIESYAVRLPESSLAKALESSLATGPDDRAAYIVGALTSELDALDDGDPEPGPSELSRAEQPA